MQKKVKKCITWLEADHRDDHVAQEQTQLTENAPYYTEAVNDLYEENERINLGDDTKPNVSVVDESHRREVTVPTYDLRAPRGGPPIANR